MKSNKLIATALRPITKGGVQQVPKLKCNLKKNADGTSTAPVEEVRAERQASPLAAADYQPADCKENSPPGTIARRTRGREAGKSAAAAKAIALPDDGAGASAPPDSGQPAIQPEERAAARQPEPERKVLRTGQEIWEFNMKLGSMAEQLGDPEDSKRRRYKEPTLQEKLHKIWGGTYADKLEKEVPSVEVEAEPAPKYEPPVFLKEAMDSDEDAPAELMAPASNARAVAPTAGQAAEPPVPVRAQAATAKKGAASGGPGKGAGRKGAGEGRNASRARPEPVAEELEQVLDEHGGGVDVDGEQRDPVPSTAGRGQEEAPVKEQARQRGARKAAAAVASQARPKGRVAPRRGTGGPAAGAAMCTTEIDNSELGPMPEESEAASAHVPESCARVRKSHRPAYVTFGAPCTRQAACQTHSQAAAAYESVAGAADATTASGLAAAPKRLRESMAVAEAARSQKAMRLEEQQLFRENREIETLRQRVKELDQKIKEQAELLKQKDNALRAAERKAAQVEKDRSKEATSLTAIQRDHEHLMYTLGDRGARIERLKEELTQCKEKLVKAKMSESVLDRVGEADRALQAIRSLITSGG